MRMRTLDKIEHSMSREPCCHIQKFPGVSDYEKAFDVTETELRHLIAIARAAHSLYGLWRQDEINSFLASIREARKAGLFDHPATCDCVECEDAGKGVFAKYVKEGGE